MRGRHALKEVNVPIVGEEYSVEVQNVAQENE